jgi:hypothetical protein
MNRIQELINEEVERMRETKGIGRCPECGEKFARDLGPAEHGSITLECSNGHRWIVTMD